MKEISAKKHTETRKGGRRDEPEPPSVARMGEADTLAGRSLDTSAVGLVEAIGAGSDKTACATVKVPLDGGGHERCRFSIGGGGGFREICSLIGRGVEVFKGGDDGRVLLRRMTGQTIISPDGCIDGLSVHEVACVVDAHSKGHDFAGEWNRKNIEGKGAEKVLPPELAGLYVHARSNQGILVFSDANPLSAKRRGVNLSVIHGLGTAKYDAVAATVAIAGRGTNGLVAAGHSGGGAMAQYAAAKVGVGAITFNTAGIPEGLVEGGKPARVSHYFTKYERLSSGTVGRDGVSNPLAPLREGKRELLGGNSDVHVLRSEQNLDKIPDANSIDAIKRALVLDPQTIKMPFVSLKNWVAESSGELGHPGRHLKRGGEVKALRDRRTVGGI